MDSSLEVVFFFSQQTVDNRLSTDVALSGDTCKNMYILNFYNLQRVIF